MLIAFAYGLLAVLTVLLVNWRGHRSPSEVGSALLLFSMWLLSNVMRDIGASLAWPLLDLVGAMIVFRFHRKERRTWQFLLLLLFIADGACHAAFSFVIPPTRKAWYVYQLSLNVLFLLQLVVVSSTRARDVVGLAKGLVRAYRPGLAGASRSDRQP